MTDVMTSKLDMIRELLSKNGEIVVVAERKKTHPKGRWAETVDFIVAPAEALSAADTLQNFMMRFLVPDIEPTQSDAFLDGEAYMRFGKLYFDEEVPQETTAARARGGQRRIWVSLYPNILVAALAAEGLHDHDIELETLRRYEKVLPHIQKALA